MIKRILKSTIQFTKSTIASPTVKTIMGLASANTLATVVGFAGTLIQARYIVPEELGYFRGFAIASGYALFFSFGTIVILQRYYPYYIGKGNKEKALDIATICQTWNSIVFFLVSGIFCLLALIAVLMGNWKAMLAWLVQAVTMASLFYGGYLSATYRSGHNFKIVAKGALISSVAALFSLPVFFVFPYLALALRSSIGNLVNIVYLHIHRPLKLKFSFHWGKWFQLVKDGFPIFISDYGAWMGWITIEMTIVRKFLGTEALGLWSISWVLLELASKVPQAVNAVYTPRIAQTFGHSDNVKESMKICTKPVLFGVPGMVLVAGVTCAAVYYIIPILMPYYVDAIPIMSLMTLNLPLIILGLPNFLLVSMGKVVQQNIATYVSLLVFVGFSYFAITQGYGLPGVVLASIGGKAFRVLLVYVFIFLSYGKQPEPESIKSNPQSPEE